MSEKGYINCSILLHHYIFWSQDSNKILAAHEIAFESKESRSQTQSPTGRAESCERNTLDHQGNGSEGKSTG